MGDHYVPQYYLKGFSEGLGETIWVYDKKSKRRFSTQVKNIANETAFYSPEVEQYLANMVEGPANAVLGKIHQREWITEGEKELLAEYMAAMIKRVPRGKQLVKQLAPDTAQKLSDKITMELVAIATQDPSKAELVERRRSEIQKILDIGIHGWGAFAPPMLSS